MISAQGKKNIIYAGFLSLYTAIFIVDFINKSQWAYDVVIAVVITTALWMSSKRLKVTPEGFFLANIGFTLHIIGSFGLYGMDIGPIEYDNIVHFVSSFAAAYIIFNYISRAFHLKRQKKVIHTVVDDHRTLLIVLVIASVAMLGVAVELLEFGGFLYLGEGEGILFVGAGDSNRGGDSIEGQYIDTMTDIMVNSLGSMLGAFSFYTWRYQKRYSR